MQSCMGELKLGSNTPPERAVAVPFHVVAPGGGDGLGGQEAKRLAWRRTKRAADTCNIYLLDASDVAERIGVPRCHVDHFGIDPRKSLILPNPAHLPIPLPDKDTRVDGRHTDDMYPWKVCLPLRHTAEPSKPVCLALAAGSHSIGF